MMTPIAHCVARRARDGVWDLEVSHCPICSGCHVHGGGADGVPDPGYRTVHCANTFGTYELVIVAIVERPQQVGRRRAT